MNFNHVRLIYILLFLFFYLFPQCQEVNIDPQQKVCIESIIFKGIEHTKEQIILRELEIQPLDTIVFNKLHILLEESKYNLLKTGLFNFVEYQHKHAGNNLLSIVFIFQERWYLWPYPILEHADRNFGTWLDNKNWNRINYGIQLTKYNFRGKAETLVFKFRKGYREQYAVRIEDIYINLDRNHSLSADLSYFRQKEIDIDVKNNRLVSFSLGENYIYKNFRKTLKYGYRSENHKNFFNLSFKNEAIKINDSITKLNDNFLLGNNNSLNYSQLIFDYTYDTRNSRVYPLKGKKIVVNLEQTGLNIFSDPINFKSLHFELQQYNSLLNAFYISTILKLYKSEKVDKPFIFAGVLGYEDYISGYENYVFHGDSYLLWNTNLIYELIDPEVFYIPYIKNQKFSKSFYAVYLKYIINAGYVSNSFETENLLENSFLFSSGFGIDLITYYDKKVSLELTWNNYSGYEFFAHLGMLLDIEGK